MVQWDLLPTLHDLYGSKFAKPTNLDGASLWDVLARGNDGDVERPVEGLVFHYPCNFAPPLSVIRIGDYKYMKHLLTGEVKLFKLKRDLAEKRNVAKAMPEKVAEFDQALTRYLSQVDAEDVQEVYKAPFYKLNEFEKRARETHAKEVARAKGDKDIITKADEKLAMDLERFKKNRQECRENKERTDSDQHAIFD